MAISKALSGAPIYLSDNPSDFHAAFIRPLAYEDGELLGGMLWLFVGWIYFIFV